MLGQDWVAEFAELTGNDETGHVRAALREAGFGDEAVERGLRLWEQNAFIDFDDMCTSLQEGCEDRHRLAGVTESSIEAAGVKLEENLAAGRAWLDESSAS